MNAELARARGHKEIRDQVTLNDRPLAIVGAGPSVKERLEQLLNWPGDIWAINGAWDVLRANGIKSTFFAIDPLPVIAKFAVSGPSDAILATRCDPAVFDAMKGRVRVVDLDDPTTKFAGGTTAATWAPYIGLRAGHKRIAFFGCEGSFPPDASTHAGWSDGLYELIVVSCDGKEFGTQPSLLVQAEMLADMVAWAPHVFEDRSGGLLSALINDPDYEVTGVCQELAALMQPINPAEQAA
ncbi:MAG TPA: hypothetical protein VEA41_07280 [Salinarimonas sp.]|nr:hypothetical protein [Salinarimonas sp.]